MRPIRTLVILALGLALAACTRVDDLATSPDGTPSGTASPSASPTGPTTDATIYYVLESNGRLSVVPETHEIVAGELGVAELTQMVKGRPHDPDLRSPWPATASVTGVTVEHGTAIVDWNADVLTASAGASAETAAIQQAVYTLTELPGIERVQFVVEGKAAGTASNGRAIEDWWGHVGLSEQPFERDEDALAPITIERPDEGAEVSDRVRVGGTARVVEANVIVRLRDPAGRVAEETNTTASIGGPERGTWELTLDLPNRDGETWTIEAVEESLEDGSDFFVTTRTIRIVR